MMNRSLPRSRALMLLPLVAVVALAACSSTPLPPPAAAPMPTAAPVAAAPAAATPAAPMAESAVATVTVPDYLNPQSPIANQRSVYFEFDEVALNDADNAVIERHGKYLAAHPALKIRVEGNTDERGGTEYNLALG